MKETRARPHNAVVGCINGLIISLPIWLLIYFLVKLFFE